MKNKQSTAAILIGEESLLTLCAEYLLQVGWTIQAIVSNAPVIHAWAGDQNVPILAQAKDILSLGYRPHFLFSVTNLRPLSTEVVKFPQIAAFNFHDGPLPERAGLNVPNWSIINGETSHAVTWHEILPVLDTGGIAVRSDFDIASDETTFSLNTKCFEHGIDSFKQLIKNISTGALKLSEPTDPQQFFARDLKPQQLGFIDWTNSGEDIVRLYRATLTRGYKNPLCQTKILVGSKALVPGRLSFSAHADLSHQAGQIVSCSDTELEVACRDGVVTIRGIFDLQGFPITNATLALSPSAQLPSLPSYLLEGLAQDNQILMQDSFWLSVLASFDPLNLTSLTGHHHATQWHRDLQQQLDFDFESLSLEQKLAALLVLMARLGDTDSANLLIAHESQLNMHQSSGGFFSASVPVAIDINTSVKHLQEAIGGIFNRLPATIPPAVDLAVRFPEQRQSTKCLFAPDFVIVVLNSESDLKRYSNGNEYLTSVFPNTSQLVCFCEQENSFHLRAQVSTDAVNQLTTWYSAVLEFFTSREQQHTKHFELFSDQDQVVLDKLHAGSILATDSRSVADLFRASAAKYTHQACVVDGRQQISYRQLDKESDQVAAYLINTGTCSGDLVGVLMSKSIRTVTVMLGIMKAGAAYVPLDPQYPVERIHFIILDSGLTTAFCDYDVPTTQLDMLADMGIRTLNADEIAIETQLHHGKLPNITGHQTAYVIYTSGSTGQPKGVIVSHSNVNNFFCGMDKIVGVDPGVMLSVTSISFDISVLELWWTLSRGYKVVLHQAPSADQNPLQLGSAQSDIAFSLYYWNTQTNSENGSVNSGSTYQLLIEGAKFADANSFAAVWTPERHFGDFGGFYPNPSVTSAAVATCTSEVQIRGGSCVLPLHHPARVAEEWAVVDNLSNGRAGVSFASGWMPDDFILAPGNFATAKDQMFSNILTVEKLWRGEAVTFAGPKGDVAIKTLPRPIQSKIPVWITSAGSRETFEAAGTQGYNILTHLLGQDAANLEANVKAYREAWNTAGHANSGQVTLMLHTFLAADKDQAKSIAKEPMKAFLQSSLSLVKQAAWDFPTYKKFSSDGKASLDEYFSSLSADELDELLEFAFERYFRTNGLFGSPADCYQFVCDLKAIGVDEIGCLIDFGINSDTVLHHLKYLVELKNLCQHEQQGTFAELVDQHEVTHLQCTPSQAGMLILDQEAKQGLSQLECLLVGGEAINQQTADQLCDLVPGRVINMYGPTETTVWSTSAQLSSHVPVNIGRPIVNTNVLVLDSNLRRCPVDLPGQLYIGGAGVTKGYHNRATLTAERFVDLDGQCYYATGDIVRLNKVGFLVYLGRNDNQVKIRGYRIELGEIENTLAKHAFIRQVAIVVDEDQWGNTQLAAYFTADRNLDNKALRSQLAKKLPDYMIPSSFRRVLNMPMTPNGKIDRKLFDSAELLNESDSTRVLGPSGDVEKQVHEIWSQLLDTAEIDTRANFFDIGGHSILAVRMQALLKGTFSRKFPISDLFSHPTIESLAVHIGEANSSANKQSPKSKSRNRAAIRRRMRDK